MTLLIIQRFGDPFTTVQVENVKSFLYIFSIVLGTFGYGFLDSKSKLFNQYLTLMQTVGRNSFFESLLLIYPLTVPYLGHCIYCAFLSIYNSPFLLSLHS